MGPVNWMAVRLATLAFFAMGALWYGVLFGGRWRALVGAGEPPRGGAMARVMLGTLICELLICATLGHQFARTDPAPRAMMMIAVGFGATVMAPAVGINYLHQRKPLALFLIDAGHLVVGMVVVGLVFVALR